MKPRILTKNLKLSDAVKGRIARRLHFALGRFLPAIKSVELSLRDENGPRGGTDTSCRITVKLNALQNVVVEGRGEQTSALVDRTSDRAARAVARALNRCQKRPGIRSSGDGPRRSSPRH